MPCLGLDIGSSFIKGAVLDADVLTLRHIERVQFPEPVRGLVPEFREFDPGEIVGANRLLRELLLSHAPDAAGVLICSQLHGLVLTGDDGRAAPIFIKSRHAVVANRNLPGVGRPEIMTQGTDVGECRVDKDGDCDAIAPRLAEIPRWVREARENTRNNQLGAAL